MKKINKKVTLKDVYGIFKNNKGLLKKLRAKTWSRFDEFKGSQKRGK